MSVDGSITPALLDGILEHTLPALVEELSDCDWYVREREVINLFVFGHLVPAFQASGLDLTLIGIEAAVLQVERNSRSRLGAYKDLVIWREPRTSRFKGCRVSRPLDYEYLRKHGCKPLAIVEWKNISRIIVNPAEIVAGHRYDVEWLKDNLRAEMCELGYAILVDQSTTPCLNCRRLTATTDVDFLRLPITAVAKGAGR